MIRFLTSCCVACVAMTSVAQAQFFGFGPFGGVRVRAPFVAVDVTPYGGTRVVAPFTHVDTRYYGGFYGPVPPVVPVPPFPVPVYPAPVYPAPVYPAPVYPHVVHPVPQSGDYQVARPAIPGSVAVQLRASAERLARSLSTRRDDGDVWLRYLDPQRIIEVIDRGESPESLRGLIANYDGVVGNAGLVSIRSASGFHETRQLLRAFVNSPPQQPAQQPAGAADSAPVPAPDDQADGPTPAPPIQPAVEEEKKAEESPVPPPPKPAVPVPPEPTPI